MCHVPALRTPPRLTAFSRPSGFRPLASAFGLPPSGLLSFSLGTPMCRRLLRLDNQVATRASAHLLLTGPSRLPELHGLSVRHKHCTHHQRLSTLHLYTNSLQAGSFASCCRRVSSWLGYTTVWGRYSRGIHYTDALAWSFMGRFSGTRGVCEVYSDIHETVLR